MNIAESYALWGLLGLSIPILIHLLSKKEKSMVKFSSLRFLKPTESQSAKSIQLSQFPLLLLRMLLFAAVCLLMAQPLITDNESQVCYWIEDGLKKDGSYDSVLPLNQEDIKMNSFSFDATADEKVHQYKSAWTLIDKLNDSHDSVIVYTHSLQRHFIGDPVAMNNHIAWNVVPKKLTQKPITKGGIELPWSMISNADSTVIANQIIERNKETLPPFRLQLINNEEGEESYKIKEIIDLSEDLIPYPIQWVEETAAVDWKIIVGDHEMIEESASIQWLPSDRLLTIESVKPDQLLLKGQLSKDALLKSNLPVLLAAAFNKDYISIYKSDNRVHLPEYAKTKEVLAGINNVRKSPISRIWWIVVLLLIGLERIFSYQLSKA